MLFRPSSARTSVVAAIVPSSAARCRSRRPPRESVEHAHRQARLDQTGGTDGLENLLPGGRQVGQVAVGRLGEGQEDRAVGNSGAAAEGRSRSMVVPSAELLARSSARWLDVQSKHSWSLET